MCSPASCVTAGRHGDRRRRGAVRSADRLPARRLRRLLPRLFVRRAIMRAMVSSVPACVHYGDGDGRSTRTDHQRVYVLTFFKIRCSPAVRGEALSLRESSISRRRAVSATSAHRFSATSASSSGPRAVVIISIGAGILMAAGLSFIGAGFAFRPGMGSDDRSGNMILPASGGSRSPGIAMNPRSSVRPGRRCPARHPRPRRRR